METIADRPVIFEDELQTYEPEYWSMEAQSCVKINGTVVEIYYQGWGWHAFVKGIGEIAYSLDDMNDVIESAEKRLNTGKEEGTEA